MGGAAINHAGNGGRGRSEQSERSLLSGKLPTANQGQAADCESGASCRLRIRGKLPAANQGQAADCESGASCRLQKFLSLDLVDYF